MASILAVLALALAAATGAADPQAGALAPFPELDRGQKRAMLVVATLEPGPDLAPDPYCMRADVICLDNAPFTLRATGVVPVLGGPVPQEMLLATSSHYGKPEREDLAGTRWLVRGETDGEHFVMWRYTRARMQSSRWGEPYLLLWEGNPPWWLPCSVETLREEVAAADFPGGEEEGRIASPEEPESHLVFSRRGAFPRHGIALSRLRAHLASLGERPTDDALECKRDDE